MAAPTLPATSMASTWKVWVPVASAGKKTGLALVAKAAPSRLVLNVSCPGLEKSSTPVKANVAEV